MNATEILSSFWLFLVAVIWVPILIWIFWDRD